MFNKKKVKIELKNPESDMYIVPSSLLNFQSFEVLNEDEKICYSIRILLNQDETATTPCYREVWRTDSLEEANEIQEFLNSKSYFWVPTKSEGKVIIEKINI